MPASRAAAVASVFMVAVAATACAGTPPPDGSARAATETRPTSQPPSEIPNTEELDTVTALRITVAGRTLTAELADNPTAQDLLGQLPLTLTFRDFNRVEKVAELARPLTMEGVPPGDDPEISDIGYYAPSRSLVLYYGDVGYWDGIVRIGRLQDPDMQLIQRQPDGFEVTIEAVS